MCWANQQHSPAHYPVAWCLKQKHNITQSKEEAARRDASDSSRLKNESVKWGLFFFDINPICMHFAYIWAYMHICVLCQKQVSFRWQGLAPHISHAKHQKPKTGDTKDRRKSWKLKTAREQGLTVETCCVRRENKILNWEFGIFV